MEFLFDKDQREKVGQQGNMQISSIDKTEAVRQAKLLARKKNPDTSGVVTDDSPKNTYEDTQSCDPVEVCDTDRDDNFVLGGRRRGTNQNRNKIENFISEVERYGISDRAAASLLNAALKDLNIIKDGKDKDAVDKYKIRRGRDSYRQKQKVKMKNKVEAAGGLTCLGADGKRDKKTRKRVVEIIDGKEFDKNVVTSEEHVAYTMEPSGEYLCHSTIDKDKGTGRGLADDFIDVLADHNSSGSIEAVVADGTNVNTGWRNGFIAHVERSLKRNLLWLICMAHGNELPMRHLFTHCDGGHGTSGPDSFAGPLGQECKGQIHLLDVAKFSLIETTVPDLDDTVWKDLSRDQHLLYRYCS